jgi:succinate dehydrogenase / fumarate reductase cytochrome b subunit
MTTLALTITETLRYRGKLGQWSWVLHRLAGLGTLLFLYLHVIDTSWAVFYPDLYERAIKLYQSPLFTIGEFGLIACVVYHAYNGFRIVLTDWRPKWWKHQDRAAQIVLAATLITLIPTFLIMIREVISHYQEKKIVLTFESLLLGELIVDNAPFAIGAVALAVGGIALSTAYSFVEPKTTTSKRLKRNRLDQIMWSFMRVSGVIIIPLVFGHLAMMHVIQGVFKITEAGHVPVGTTFVNTSGLATEFVLDRWNQMFAGVLIWRVYDALLLALVVIHGFWGLHYIVQDYVHNKVIQRGLQLAVLATAVGLLVVGSAAIISTAPSTTDKMLEKVKKTAVIMPLDGSSDTSIVRE